jgi:hypothetical protein
MNRLVVLALLASLGPVSAAVADDSLLTSGARHVQQITRAEAAGAPTAASTSPAGAAVSIGRTDGASFQAGQGTGTLSGSGMRKRTKLMIALGIGAGFAAGAWTIDHHVLDVTPSSLGTRQD